MKKQNELSVIPDEVVMSKIYLIRGEKVMLDNDLAELYGVETRRLNEQVKRNIERFPEDFMLQLTKHEFNDMKSQIATSSWGGRRTLPGRDGIATSGRDMSRPDIKICCRSSSSWK